jgi:uncharacterized protein
LLKEEPPANPLHVTIETSFQKQHVMLFLKAYGPPKESLHRRHAQKQHEAKPTGWLTGPSSGGEDHLLEQKAKAYHVLDKKSEQEAAHGDPEAYLRKRAGHWVALDECQSVPALFPELKEWVRTHQSPGQFILSGSVRFTSREAIKESLTGRIVNLELFPFLWKELRNQPLSRFLLDLLDVGELEKWSMSRSFGNWPSTKVNQSIREHWQRGGLPGVCFIRDAKQRAMKIEEQLLTILDRDARLVKKLALSVSDIRAVLEAVARSQGLPLQVSSIQKSTGVSTPSIKKLLYIFEAVFLIRPVRIQGSTMGIAYFFEDQAEVNHLAGQKAAELELLTHFLFTQLRAQFAYRVGETYSLFQYRTRGGAYIPLCYQTQKGVVGVLPVIGKVEDELARSAGSIRSFLSAYANSKVLVVHLESEKLRALSPRVLSAPVATVI